jgi:hypothetical protein
MSEFVLDWYDVAFCGRPAAIGRARRVAALTPSSENYRVIRDDSYDSTRFDVRVAIKFEVRPAGRLSGIGMRCARES